MTDNTSGGSRGMSRKSFLQGTAGAGIGYGIGNDPSELSYGSGIISVLESLIAAKS